jgi:hypothetical protein
MSPVQEKYELILQRVDALLAPEGFKKSGRCFRKRLPQAEVRWSICFQKTRHSTAGEIDFTFEVRAESKERPPWCEDYVPRETWYGGAGRRIGHLMPKKDDAWWEIVDGTSAEVLSAQINEVLISYALPFLKQFQTEQHLSVYHRKLSDSPEWKRNYPVAIDALAYALFDKKDDAEVEKRINNVRHVGKINGADKTVIEATIERVLKTYGPERASLQKQAAARIGFPGFGKLLEIMISKLIWVLIRLIQKLARFFAPK